jgi:hypothetical protein
MDSANVIAGQLVTALELELGNVPDEIPQGFRMITEWAALWGRGTPITEKILRRHVASGRMEMRKFRRKCDKQTRLTRYFKAIK